MLLVVVSHRPPHCTVALEATAESNLPNPVALPDASCGLDVGQNVPASRRATRSISRQTSSTRLILDLSAYQQSWHW